MTCRECESSRTRRWHGGYDLACLPCCARLVLSAHPSRPHAGAMLAAVERWLLQQSPPPFSVKDVTTKAREMLPAFLQQRAEQEAAQEALSRSVAAKALTTLRRSTAGRSGAKWKGSDDR